MKTPLHSLCTTVLCVLLASCGGEATSVGDRLYVDQAGPVAMTVGTVVDSAGVPIAGATISTGDNETWSGADGSWNLDLPRGRYLFTVEAAGYVPVTREVAVGAMAFPEEFRLAARGQVQSIPVEGGELADGDAGLEFADGTFEMPTVVGLTWLPRASAASWPGEAFFSDDDGNAMRVLGMVDIDTAAQPLKPVLLRVEIQEDWPSSGLVLYSRDGADDWTLVGAPTRTDEGSAWFEVTHFSEYGVCAPDDMEWLIRQAGGTVTARDDSGNQWNVAEGDSVPAGTTISTDKGAKCEIETAGGRRIQLSCSTKTKLENVTATDRAVHFMYGYVRTIVRKHGGETKVQGRHGTGGVRGTAFSFMSALIDGFLHEKVEVMEGEIDLTSKETSTVLSAGQSAATCENCDVEPSCDDDNPADPAPEALPDATDPDTAGPDTAMPDTTTPDPGASDEGTPVDACTARCETEPGVFACKDLQNDSANCGECGKTCDTFHKFRCIKGQCACPSGTNSCPSTDDPAGLVQACVDFQTSLTNCGKCTWWCYDGSCDNGTCRCPDGWTGCDMPEDSRWYWVGVYCKDTRNDPNYCGSCDHGFSTVGELAPVCQGGILQCTGENAGKTTCKDPRFVNTWTCIDTSSDKNHCGECGNSIETSDYYIDCVGGQPVCTSIYAGNTFCRDASNDDKPICVDTNTSVYHCGGCNISCHPEQHEAGATSCDVGQCKWYD